MIVYVLSLSKLETVLAQAVGQRLNGELQTPNTPQHFAIFHHYIQKCYGRPFLEEKKLCKIINNTIAESTENV